MRNVWKNLGIGMIAIIMFLVTIAGALADWTLIDDFEDDSQDWDTYLAGTGTITEHDGYIDIAPTANANHYMAGYNMSGIYDADYKNWSIKWLAQHTNDGQANMGGVWFRGHVSGAYTGIGFVQREGINKYIYDDGYQDNTGTSHPDSAWYWNVQTYRDDTNELQIKWWAEAGEEPSDYTQNFSIAMASVGDMLLIRKLTSNPVSAHYYVEEIYYWTDAPPVSDNINITALTPTAYQNFSTNTIQLNVSVNTSFDTSCKLYINGELNDTNSVSTGQEVISTFTETFADGNYYYHFFCGNSTDNETTSDINFTIDYWREVYMVNEWDNTNVTNLNATCGGIEYTTATDILLLNFSSNQMCTYDAPNYIEKNYTFDFSDFQDHNGTMIQSRTKIQSTEILTGNYINNFTIWIDGYNFSTTNGSVYLNPNFGTYNVNWTTGNHYFNQTALSMTIDENSESLIVSNLYARNISFHNSRAIGTTLTPNCTQGSYEYTSYPYKMPYDTQNMTCTLAGYQDVEFSMNATPDSTDYPMTPAMLWLVFSELTQGYVETEDCSENPNNCDWFNTTDVYIEQANISIGKVVVKFNPDGSGNWQQIFEYYNDADTHMKEYIEIITPDLVQNLKITGEGTPLEDARVVVKTLAETPITNVTDWITIYADFTSIDGVAVVLLNDENTYKFCAQKEGYTTKCVIDYVPPSSTDIIVIDLEATETPVGYNFIASSCPNAYYRGYNCTLEVNTYKSYNTICLNYTSDTLNTSTCSSDSISKAWSYELTNENGNVTIGVYLDGVLERTIYHNYMGVYEPDNDINWDSQTDISGQTLLDRIKGNKTYLIVVYIILTIIGVIMGFMAEKYFNGYGIYGSAIWFLVLAMGQLYIFWIPVIMIGVYAIIEKLVPLFLNK